MTLPQASTSQAKHTASQSDASLGDRRRRIPLFGSNQSDREQVRREQERKRDLDAKIRQAEDSIRAMKKIIASEEQVKGGLEKQLRLTTISSSEKNRIRQQVGDKVRQINKLKGDCRTMESSLATYKRAR
jgi:predicted RNase H-like nuclease (RuvC/YqgF family)